MKLAEIITKIDEIYPFSLQEDWDNSGFQLGDPNAEITSALTALDLTEEVLLEAKRRRANLIITHHPLFYKGVTAIDQSYGKGRLIAALIQSGIAVISCHTNLDKAADGVSTALAKRLGLTLCCPFYPCNGGGSFGMIGLFPKEATLETFAKEVKEKLYLDVVRIVGDKNRPIRTVAVMGGAGSDFIEYAKEKNADVYVTADLKYHQGQAAAEMGLALIDAGHFGTEVFVLEPFTQKLAAAMPEVTFAIAESIKDFWYAL